MGFIEAQADYIRFLYGLSLMILATVAFTERLLGRCPISLRWLAIFGALHGLYEWFHVVTDSRISLPGLATTKELLGLASICALLEFARVNWLRLLPAPRIPGWPPLVAMLVGCIFLTLEASTAFTVTTRLLFAASTLWAAVAILRAGQTKDLAGRPWLLTAAIILILYGQGESSLKTALYFAAERGLIDSPHHVLSSCFAAIHGTLSAILASALWIYVRRLRPATTSTDGGQKARLRYTIWLAASLLIVLGAGWYGTQLLGQKAEEHARSRTLGATRILANHLRDEMARTDLMAGLLAKSPVAQLTLQHRTPENLAWAENMLRQHTALLESSTAFLMTADGTIVVSSSGPEDSGKKGENFGFLPYFQDSSAYGLAGRDLAVEPTPGQRGYYVSNPVTDSKGEILGIAVVKKVLAQTDKEFKRFANWFLLSPNGIVFLSSRPELLLKPMWTLPTAARSQLAQSGQLGPGPFHSAILDAAPIDGLTMQWEGSNALSNVISVREDGWTAVIIEPLSEVAGQRLYGIAITLFVSLFIVCFFVVVQREASYEQQLAEDKVRLEALNEELERQATTDALTGACNRLKFDALLLAEVDRANRYGSSFALVMFDIDHFKRINDNYGHQTGDRVLEVVSRLSKESVRRSDVFARWGGEEFMILLPMTPMDGTIVLVERLRDAMRRFAFDPVPVVTCSFGVTEYRRGDTAASLIKRADDALYRAKEAGRNRVELAIEGAPPSTPS